MLYPSLAIFIGFVLLVWGADRFVLGASAAARNLGVSPLIVGLTIVGFGTSAPEMLVSAVASWGGSPGIGIGNAIGSNITNIALVLGVTALAMPLTVHSSVLRRELPVLVVIMLFTFLLLADNELSRGDGLLLIFGMGLMIYWVVTMGMRTRRSDPIVEEFDAETPQKMTMLKASIWLLIGMLVLVLSSQILVWGAVEIAQMFGISDLVIGLTVIAIGTSLPELAASLMSAYRKEYDIAIGNIIGSNMFNLLGVLAMPGLIMPGPVSHDVLIRDYPLMIGLTLALFAMAYGFRGGVGRINRIEGGILLCVYIIYMVVLYQTST